MLISYLLLFHCTKRLIFISIVCITIMRTALTSVSMFSYFAWRNYPRRYFYKQIDGAVMGSLLNLLMGSLLNLQSFTKYLRSILAFMWSSALRKKFNFCFFQGFFPSIDKIFILAGRLDTRLSFYEALTLSS